jgi:hypothetical protein
MDRVKEVTHTHKHINMCIFSWNLVPMLLLLQSPLLKYVIFSVSELHTASCLTGYHPECSWVRSLKLHPYSTINMGLYFPAFYICYFWCSGACVWSSRRWYTRHYDIKTFNGINWRQIDRRWMATPFESLTESIMYLTPRKFAIKAVEAVRGVGVIFSKGR